MFVHIFTYRLKCLLRDREMIFWTLLFPIALATLFHMAFSNLGNTETFHVIPIAVVKNEAYQKNDTFRQVLKQVSGGEDRLFDLTESSKAEAEQLLSDNAIDGYIILESQIKMVVNHSGLNQNILKSFLDNYIQTSLAVESILAEGSVQPQRLLAQLGKRESYVKEVSATQANPDTILNYFYALIAMTCFYGGFYGMREITDIQANISPVAARVNVAPVHKLKTFLYSSCASLLINFSGLLLLLCYLLLVLRIDFGSKAGYVLLTTFTGSVAGISFGAFISALVKKSEGKKEAILIGVTMLCSMLAGMMFHSIKYTLSKNVPILSYLNPVNLLTDAFYSLYYYDTLTRYTLNVGLLCVFILVFCSGTYFVIRRRKYASL